MRYLFAILLLAFASPAFAQFRAADYQNCPGGYCPRTPVRSLAVAVVEHKPIRSATAAVAHAAVCRVQCAAQRVRCWNQCVRPRLFCR